MNSPITMVGTPVSTSVRKLATAANRPPYSTTATAAAMPVGTEIRVAIPTMIRLPMMPFTNPPPGCEGSPGGVWVKNVGRSEEHTSELQSHVNLVCRLLLEKKK